MTVNRNLTPDEDTGLARRTGDELKRVLRSDAFAEGHVVSGTAMPWPLSRTGLKKIATRSSYIFGI